MRIAEVHPKEEGLVLRTLVEELVHLRRHVLLAGGIDEIEALLEGAHLLLVEHGLRGRRSTTGAIEMITAPAYADEITSFALQDLRKRDLIPRQRRGEARDARCDWRAPRHDRRPRWHTLRRAGEHAAKHHPLRREAVETRRLHLLATVAAEERVAVVVGEHEEDVRPRRQ
jgi:hypothetical protein